MAKQHPPLPRAEHGEPPPLLATGSKPSPLPKAGCKPPPLPMARAKPPPLPLACTEPPPLPIVGANFSTVPQPLVDHRLLCAPVPKTRPPVNLLYLPDGVCRLIIACVAERPARLPRLTQMPPAFRYLDRRFRVWSNAHPKALSRETPELS